MRGWRGGGGGVFDGVCVGGGGGSVTVPVSLFPSLSTIT